MSNSECWNEIHMQDVAESCTHCRVVTINPYTGIKESHILVPSESVLEGIFNGGMNRYKVRSEIVSVDVDDINRLW